MLIYLLTTVHIIVCFILIGVVLLQSGKAADLAGAFGGMGSQTAFGPRGAQTILTKATAVAAIGFMVTSLSLAIVASRRGSGPSVLDSASKAATKPADKKPASTPAPVAPAQAPNK